VGALTDEDTHAVREITDLRVSGNLLFAATNKLGWSVFDVADPTQLRVLSSNQTDRQERNDSIEFAPAERHVYVGAHETSEAPASISVWSLDEPAQPALRACITPNHPVEGMAVAADRLLVAAHRDGLIIYRRAVDGTISESARLGGFERATRVRWDGGHVAYVLDTEELVAVDLSDPDAPVAVSALALPGTPHDLALSGDRGVVALGAGGVGLIRLADAEEPELLDVADTAGTALRVDLSADGKAAFVADWQSLRVFAVEGDSLRPIGREPADLAGARVDEDAGTLESRTLAVAAGSGAVFAGTWVALDALVIDTAQQAADLVAQPMAVRLPALAADATSGAVVSLVNEGSLPLEITSITTDAAGFSVADDRPGTLGPGERRNLRIEYDAAVATAPRAFLTVRSDDVDEPELRVWLRAPGDGAGLGDLAPDARWQRLDLSPTSLEAESGPGPVLLSYFAMF
jgi:hypothetical protein